MRPTLGPRTTKEKNRLAEQAHCCGECDTVITSLRAASCQRVTLPEFAAERRAADPGGGAAVNRHRLDVQRTAANPQHAAAAVE